MLWKVNSFEPELRQINSENIRKLAEHILNKVVPDRMFVIRPSSSGKYHPLCTKKRGGLVLHIKRLVFLARHLAEACGFNEEEKDLYVVAAIVHDMYKRADYKKYPGEYNSHPITEADALREMEDTLLEYINKNQVKKLYGMVENHMGRWTPESVKKPLTEYTLYELVMYFSDYLSSRQDVTTPVDVFELDIPESVKDE